MDGSVRSKGTITTNKLSRLPPELRNKIYRFSLVAGTSIDITKASISERTTLLKVCQQFRAEATKIFYSENAFRIADVGAQATDAIAFMELIGEDHPLSMPKLVIGFPMTEESRSILHSLVNAAGSQDSASNRKKAEAFQKSTEKNMLAGVNFLSALERLHIPLDVLTVEKLETTEGSEAAREGRTVNAMGIAFEIFIDQVAKNGWASLRKEDSGFSL